MQQERLISISHRLITSALNNSAAGKVNEANSILADLRELLNMQPGLDAGGESRQPVKTFAHLGNGELSAGPRAR